MSFKREGDDKSQLNILKKRRVADLLSNFIPEDEAALMKNGRYTCLVCSFRPVFDTVDMLTVHRKGRRHLEGLKAFYGKKARLKNEMTKRQHENYVQAEDTRQEPSSSAPLITQTRKLTQHALLKTVPYNSCHRKTSTKSDKRSVSTGSNPNSNADEQEKICWKTDVSSSPPCSRSGDTAANKESTSPENIHRLQPEVTQDAEPITPQRRRELEHYLRLKRHGAAMFGTATNGWIQDRSGQWIKDENVEFDSDEEEPPLLSP